MDSIACIIGFYAGLANECILSGGRMDYLHGPGRK